MLRAALRHEQAVTIAALSAAIGLAWAWLLLGAGIEMGTMEMGGGEQMLMPPTWGPGYTALIFFMWAIMMVAMMLPSAAPTILLVAAIARQRSAGSTGSTGLFASGYIVVWKGFSLGATVLQWALDRAGLGGRPDDWAANRGGCDRISLPRNPQGRKIATNNFGIREMSAHPTEPMQARVDSRRCYRVSNNA